MKNRDYRVTGTDHGTWYCYFAENGLEFLAQEFVLEGDAHEAGKAWTEPEFY